MINKQHGFTLITVLILTSMASIVVLNSLRENIVQERMSGNFQKKMNSRLLAEKGVFEEAKLLQQALLNDQTLDIDGLIAATGNATGTGLIGSDATYNASISKNAAGELEIASIGERYEGDAQSSLVARFGFTPGNSLTHYSDAIIGCRGVSLGGSGKITSYDSTDPTYVGNDADVRTTVHNADVTLSGTGTIKGSVASTGSIIVSFSQSVEGDLWANKDITFPSGTSTWSTKINGNILANGNVQLKDMMVNGYVRTEKNLTLNNGVHVNHSTVDIPDILYGGSLDALLAGAENKKVAVYVAGDFTITASGESHFKIHKGVSLSLYVMGKIHIRTSPIVEETIVKLTSSDAYALNIYSGYKSGDGSLSCKDKDGVSDKFGIYIASNTEMYATIYAPDTDVRVDAGAQFTGSIRGGSVSNCGNGETRYDVALKNITSGGGSSSSAKIAFLGWSYKTPVQPVEEPPEEPIEPTI